MSAKTVIQGLEDSELIKIFQDFVVAYQFKFDKTRKEISYKCFEATWILPIAKATGYGRTQVQAYKNALKNLLELLMEDSTYVEYFADILKSNKTKVYDKDPSPPPKVQLKTEGHEPQDKYKIQYQTYAKGQFGRVKQDIHHSKINLNRSMSQKGDVQLEQAKIKLKEVQQKLNNVLSQNKVLKERLLNFESKGSSVKQNVKQSLIDKKLVIEPSLQVKKFISSQKSEKSLLLGFGNGMSKIAIPKLNLQVLPNYHKKSQKCLNEVLLQAYNDKHGAQKVY